MGKGSIKIDDLDLKDLKNTLNKLEKYSKQELSNELASTALYAVNDMTNDVPVAKNFGGTLKQSLRAERIRQNEVSIVADTEYAAYVEFGTGRFVKTTDLQKLGIDAKWAYDNFKGKGIKEVNIKPQPYFFKNITKNLILMMERINSRLDNIIK